MKSTILQNYLTGVQYIVCVPWWLACWTLTHAIGVLVKAITYRYALNRIQFISDESSAELALHIMSINKVLLALSTLLEKKSLFTCVGYLGMWSYHDSLQNNLYNMQRHTYKDAF